MTSPGVRESIAGLWDVPVTVERNHFVHKALSSFSCNLFVGCSHRCLFCYVPDTSTLKLSKILAFHGVTDPVMGWGRYVFPRPLDEEAFLRSLRKAESLPAEKLNADGNRAVMFCSTSDPYQTIRCPDQGLRRRLQSHAEYLTRRSLELIRDHSSLNVRILTRSPLARRDFNLLRSFGHRAMLGISLPTLDTGLAGVFEPGSPAPRHRLNMLQDAHRVGIPTFVAVAPAYPGTTSESLVNLFGQVASARPLTIFFEPINVRMGVAERIAEAARVRGLKVNTAPFRNGEAWRRYAIDTFRIAERAAKIAGVSERLHLWPDNALGTKASLAAQADSASFQHWLESWWNRKSEWPHRIQKP